MRRQDWNCLQVSGRIPVAGAITVASGIHTGRKLEAGLSLPFWRVPRAMVLTGEGLFLESPFSVKSGACGSVHATPFGPAQRSWLSSLSLPRSVLLGVSYTFPVPAALGLLSTGACSFFKCIFIYFFEKQLAREIFYLLTHSLDGSTTRVRPG